MRWSNAATWGGLTTQERMKDKLTKGIYKSGMNAMGGREDL